MLACSSRPRSDPGARSVLDLGPGRPGGSPFSVNSPLEAASGSRQLGPCLEGPVPAAPSLGATGSPQCHLGHCLCLYVVAIFRQPAPRGGEREPSAGPMPRKAGPPRLPNHPHACFAWKVSLRRDFFSRSVGVFGFFFFSLSFLLWFSRFGTVPRVCGVSWCCAASCCPCHCRRVLCQLYWPRAASLQCHLGHCPCCRGYGCTPCLFSSAQPNGELPVKPQRRHCPFCRLCISAAASF